MASFLLFVLGLGLLGRLERELCVALLGSGLLVAVLGFLDDRRPMPARWRFAGHWAAAAWLLYWVGPLPPVPILGTPVNLGFAAVLLCSLYQVWSINLFNFMDGIDGLASLEAIGMALGGALVWWMARPDGDWPVALLFAACVGGFLVWNFPPARIFMGDAGSGFLGLVLAVFAIWSAQSAPHLFWSWFVLGGCFMVDATTTLVRRVRRGEQFHKAHRSHAYQYASRVIGRCGCDSAASSGRSGGARSKSSQHQGGGRARSAPTVMSTTDLLRRTAQALGRPARLLPVPGAALYVAAIALGKRELAQRLFGSLQVDIAKTRSLLGWAPMVSVDEGLRQTAAHFLADARETQA